jgi:hypothetical protein
MKTVRELRGTKHVPYTLQALYVYRHKWTNIQTGVKPYAPPFSLWDFKYQIFDIIILIKTN